ncbi:MAG: hypothetical protein OXR73_36560, partial [Myxococcales bacterium]|nr:hypothetical protein [Myxococcales bacterium]
MPGLDGGRAAAACEMTFRRLHMALCLVPWLSVVSACAGDDLAPAPPAKRPSRPDMSGMDSPEVPNGPLRVEELAPMEPLQTPTRVPWRAGSAPALEPSSDQDRYDPREVYLVVRRVIAEPYTVTHGIARLGAPHELIDTTFPDVRQVVVDPRRGGLLYVYDRDGPRGLFHRVMQSPDPSAASGDELIADLPCPTVGTDASEEPRPGRFWVVPDADEVVFECSLEAGSRYFTLGGEIVEPPLRDAELEWVGFDGHTLWHRRGSRLILVDRDGVAMQVLATLGALHEAARAIPDGWVALSGALFGEEPLDVARISMDGQGTHEVFDLPLPYLPKCGIVGATGVACFSMAEQLLGEGDRLVLHNYDLASGSAEKTRFDVPEGQELRVLEMVSG